MSKHEPICGNRVDSIGPTSKHISQSKHSRGDVKIRRSPSTGLSSNMDPVSVMKIVRFKLLEVNGSTELAVTLETRNVRIPNLEATGTEVTILEWTLA